MTNLAGLKPGLIVLLLGAMLMSPLAAADDGPRASSLSRRETLVLFPTAGRLDASGKHWRLPIHGWVYVPQQSRARRSAIAALFKRRHGLEVTPAAAPYFDTRINLLLADNKHGRRVVISVAGETFRLPSTGRNGHFTGEINLASEKAAAAARDGRLTTRAVLPLGDNRTVTGYIDLVPSHGISVISDIDDTVKVSHVTNRTRLWDSTFFKPFAPVPGMADLYRRMADAGIHFNFVSSSPWHLYGPLSQFLDEAGFPAAAIHLKSIRLKDSSILNILRPASETKPPQIETILARHPQRTFILIGDSGEQDPEIYAAFMRRYPNRISRILIRNVTEARPDDARFSSTFSGIDPARWQLFDDPAAITLP